MARRRGRPGDYLITDDWTGCTTYHSRVRQDYWGNLSEINLKRNLQEIATPLTDPYPVKEYRGPQYEQIGPCGFEVFPTYIGRTNIPFNVNNPLSTVLNFNPVIPDMSVGCTFTVAPDPPFGLDFLETDAGSPLTTEGGVFIVI